MPGHKWLVVAKNVYRVRTSGFRSVRKIFPILVAAPVILAIFYIVPWFGETFADELEVFFVSEVAVMFIQTLLFTFFVLFVTFPINFALNAAQEEHYDVFLAAPIEPKDVLLGRFVGDVPFYTVAIVAAASIMAALLVPLGLTILQGAVILAVFALTFLSAMWIGVILAALIRAKIGTSARGKDIGRAFSMTIALPLVALIYALMRGGVYDALVDTGSEGLLPLALDLLPSSWGADIVVDIAANPGDSLAISLRSAISFAGLCALFPGLLWFGSKAAGRAYNLDIRGLSSQLAKPEGLFYRSVRRLSGSGSFGSLVVAIFKDYGRRLENTSKVIYVVGLVFLVTLFFGDAEDSEMGVVMLLFLLPFLSGFIIGEVTVRGKENLFIYRKAPNGEPRLVKARIVQGSITILPVAALSTLISHMNTPEPQAMELLAVAAYISALSVALVTMSLGLFLMMPVFSERPADMMLNVMVGFFFMFGYFFAALLLGVFAELEGWLLILGLSWIGGLAVLQLGYRNLRRME
ncbi:MAG: hypothetical protein JSV90_04255 [Methanobacteriota archaeon]|nr:MAG: hypothetical protein JSV90_04255 [Euryarchaeota archaeon]